MFWRRPNDVWGRQKRFGDGQNSAMKSIFSHNGIHIPSDKVVHHLGRQNNELCVGSVFSLGSALLLQEALV